MPPLSSRNKMYDNKIAKTITHPHKDKKTDDIEVGLLHNHTDKDKDKDKDKEQSQLRAWKRYPCKHTGRLEGKTRSVQKMGVHRIIGMATQITPQCKCTTEVKNYTTEVEKLHNRSEKLYDRSEKIIQQERKN